nr:hypothetical protein [uncultured Prevotella sp.]
MRTSSLSPNNQHPTAKPNMFPWMRTLHHHLTINTQHPSQNMFPQMRTLSSSPNNQHPSPKQNMFPQMRTLHHQPTVNTHHPTAMSVIQ